MINPGLFKDKISVLHLAESGTSYAWQADRDIYGQAERISGNNIFSQIGLGAKSVKFTIRKNKTLTLHNAFRWQGKHCFITDITDIDRMYYEVKAALIEPKECSVERAGEPTKNELNRPVYSEPEITSFPAILTEKYLGHTQDNPMAVTETTYILVTPKTIGLEIGEIVNVGGKAYTVLIAHTLDEYKNEYEITTKGDA